MDLNHYSVSVSGSWKFAPGDKVSNSVNCIKTKCWSKQKKSATTLSHRSPPFFHFFLQTNSQPLSRNLSIKNHTERSKISTVPSCLVLCLFWFSKLHQKKLKIHLKKTTSTNQRKPPRKVSENPQKNRDRPVNFYLEAIFLVPRQHLPSSLCLLQ